MSEWHVELSVKIGPWASFTVTDSIAWTHDGAQRQAERIAEVLADRFPGVSVGISEAEEPDE